MSLYLLLDLLAISIPVLLSFEKHLRFYRRWKYVFSAIFLMLIPFVIWDYFFTVNGFWGFNPQYISSIKFFHLPLEEILFFIVVPYASMFAYYSLKHHVPAYRIKPGLSRFLGIGLVLAGLVIALLNTDKIYTFINFLAFSILLAIVLQKAPRILEYFLPIFPILLVPFFIMNGILTGTGIQEQVVWYNEQAILGLRILTIPVEDIFYGFTLILGAIFFTALFKGDRS